VNLRILVADSLHECAVQKGIIRCLATVNTAVRHLAQGPTFSLLQVTVAQPAQLTAVDLLKPCCGDTYFAVLLDTPGSSSP
jgi:hypothetical protein